jgi:hypothetical protein
MSNDTSGVRDALFCAMEMARDIRDGSPIGLIGWGIAELFDGDGVSKLIVPFANLVTDSGDTYYATKGVVGISPANVTAPTPVSGMKLGTGNTAVAKNGAGAALVTYATGSNLVFDSSFPTAATKGAGAGARIQYKSTYGAGVATVNGLNEVVIVNDAATNATSTAANTISRALLSPVVNKGASDTLAITWNHDLLGA